MKLATTRIIGIISELEKQQHLDNEKVMVKAA